jgi:hypothetical protein
MAKSDTIKSSVTGEVRFGKPQIEQELKYNKALKLFQNAPVSRASRLD